MGETYSGEDIHVRMVRLLAEGTGAASAGVWLRVGDEYRPVATWPTNGSPASVRATKEEPPEYEEATASVPVKHRGELLGMLTVDKPPNEPLTPVEQTLVTDLAGQAALLLANSRLFEDLRASRQRLVAAQDEERRRLERNLHDGAQQQLVALAVQARMAESFAGTDLNRQRELLRQMQEGIQDTLEDLRDLARGIYPPLLADKGLASAIEAQSRKVPMPVSVETDGIGRYPQEFEAAVYFCVLEALQNVSKYAGASEVTVRVWRDNEDLVFAVTDDGRGFDRRTTPLGTGMRNMSDRLAAVGGSLEVQSQLGGGTSVFGRIPIPSVEPG